jgi:hypothetical protein
VALLLTLAILVACALYIKPAPREARDAAIRAYARIEAESKGVDPSHAHRGGTPWTPGR